MANPFYDPLPARPWESAAPPDAPTLSSLITGQKPTPPYVEPPSKAPDAGPMSLDQLMREGQKLKKAVTGGQIQYEKLNDRGRMLVSLMNRQIPLSQLNRQGRELLGLPQSLGDRAHAVWDRFTQAFREPASTSEDTVAGEIGKKPLLDRVAQGAARMAGTGARAGLETARGIAEAPPGAMPGTGFATKVAQLAGGQQAPAPVKWLAGLGQQAMGAVEKALLIGPSVALETLSKLPGYDANMEDFWLPFLGQYGGRNRPRGKLAKEAVAEAQRTAPFDAVRPEFEVPQAGVEAQQPRAGVRRAYGEMTQEPGPVRGELPPHVDFEQVPPEAPPTLKALPEHVPASRQTVDAEDVRVLPPGVPGVFQPQVQRPLPVRKSPVPPGVPTPEEAQRGSADPKTLAALGLGGAAAALAARQAMQPPQPDDKDKPKPPGFKETVEGLGGLAPLAAMAFAGKGGKLPPEIARGVRERMERPNQPPGVPHAYAREVIGPLPPGDRVKPAAGPPPGTPPPPPGVPHFEPAEPTPYKGMPAEHLDGRSLWQATKESPKQAFATKLGVWESYGPAGKELSRIISRQQQQQGEWYGLHVAPVVQQLQGLSKGEKANFWEVLETPGAQPASEKVSAAMDAWDTLFGRPDRPGLIPQEADKRNILVKVYETAGQNARPFQPRFGPNGHYAPHEFDPQYVREVLRPNSKTRRMAIERLKEREGVDGDTAALMLDTHFGGKVTRVGGRIVELTPERMVGGLEHSREMNLDTYIKDPEVVAAVRGWKVGRRLAEIDHFGHLDKVVGHPAGYPHPDTKQGMPPSGLIGQIQREKGTPEAWKAHQLFHYQVGGKHPAEVTFGGLSRLITNEQTFTKLPLAFILHFPQVALGSFRTNLTTMAKGMMGTLFHPSASKQFTQELGLLAKESLRDIYATMGGQSADAAPRAAAWGLRFATKPWNMMFRANEIITANAGRLWAQRLNGMLGGGRRPRETAWLGRELERLNFSRDEIASRMREGRLQDEDVRRIAWELVDQTMYTQGAARRSEFMEHPLGRAVMQFKFWGINTGRLLHQMAWEEGIKNRNPAVLARMAILFPLLGELTNDFRSLARGTPREHPLDPEQPLQVFYRFLEDFNTVAGFGLVSEFFDRVNQAGARGALGWLAGPALGDAAQIAENGWKTLTAAVNQDEGKLRQMIDTNLRFGARQIPFVGPQLSNYMRTDPQAAKRAEQTWQQRLGIDPWDNRLKALERIDRMGHATAKRANELAGKGQVDEAQALLDRFNLQHGTRYTLNAGAISRRKTQEAQKADPEAERIARLRKLSPAVRALLDEAREASR